MTWTEAAPILGRAMADAPACQNVQLAISGMTCGACALRVEKALRAAPGVKDARVNLATEQATVSFDEAVTTSENLQAAVEDSGYAASVADDSAQTARAAAARRKKGHRRLGWTVLASGLLTAPLLGGMVSHWIGGWMPSAELSLALATPVQVVAGARFYRGALRALAAKSANMDVLVALGTTAAYLLSIWEMRGGGPVYFEAAASVITLVLLGKWLEGNAKEKTREALEALTTLRPETARVLRDGKAEDLPVEFVFPGDIILVRGGENVSADGTIIEGQSALDESLLTGESLPVLRGVGDRVIAGSINGTGVLEIEVTRVGAASTLSRIIAAVTEAQGQKPAIVRSVDRVAAVFVPSVLVIAAATLLGWLLSGASLSQAVIASVATLVIACPCALGLATPAALMVGTGVAARQGLLIQDLSALETSGRVNVVVFDKTGTLTLGQPKLTEILSTRSGGAAADALLAKAAALQTSSEHPLSQAIVGAARDRGLELPAVRSQEVLVGRGLVGEVAGARLFLGSARFMLESGMTIPDPLLGRGEEREAEGANVVWAGDGREILGGFVTTDPIRETAAQAVAQLRARHRRTIMLSGDRTAVAQHVAAQLGMDQVVAEVLPEDKKAFIVGLREAGDCVAMVGDGINDTPALAAADVGIAMGSGTELAVKTAAMSLLRPDPRLVDVALRLAQATQRKIHQNLFWAFFYNVVGIPLAALGMLSPTLAGAAMALSSVSVLSNALLLKRFNADPPSKASTTP